MVAMPGRSTATPVVVGERIFVLSDPSILFCIKKADGKIEWQKTNDRETIAPPDDLKAEKEDAAKIAELRTRLGAARRERAALDDGNATDAATRAKIGELGRQIDDMDKRSIAFCAKEGKEVKPGPAVTATCCTPVSDGNVVVALFHSGVLACYDLDGNMKWSRYLQRVRKGYGQSMSPASIGGVVCVHIDDAMYGVDLATGKTLWQDYELQHQGSPIGVQVGDAAAFLTCDGNLRSVKDGKVIQRIGGALNLFTTPAIHDDTGWWISENRRLSICKFQANGGVMSAKMSSGACPNGVFYASILFQDGLAYIFNHSPKGLPKGTRTLHVLDAKTRKVVRDIPVTMGGNAYPSPTGAGGFVYVSSDSGKTTVLWPGKDLSFKEVAVNSLDTFTSCPVFERDRMYVRTHKALYCIAASEEDKKEAAQLKADGLPK
jgi:hypothetical protein